MQDKTRFTFRFPVNLKRKALNIAIERGIALNALILEALWEYVERKDTTLIK